MFDLAHLSQGLFGPDGASNLSAGQVAARSLLMYLLGLTLVRIGKSRLLSRATPLDVILAFMLGSLLSRGINGSGTLTGTAIAASTLVLVHWCLTALACRSHWLGDLIKGHSHLLVSNGLILWENLRRSHISEHDLREEMRLNANIDDVRRIECAFKERSGQVGVVKKDVEPKVIDVAVRDGVQTIRIEVG